MYINVRFREKKNNLKKKKNKVLKILNTGDTQSLNVCG